jgi:hypothetical protein
MSIDRPYRQGMPMTAATLRLVEGLVRVNTLGPIPVQARPDPAGGLSVVADEHAATLPCAACPGVGSTVSRHGGDAA